jgi:hypothetical protein
VKAKNIIYGIESNERSSWEHEKKNLKVNGSCPHIIPMDLTGMGISTGLEPKRW